MSEGFIATWTGWLGVGLIAIAAVLPLSYRIRAGKRPLLASRAIGLHSALGAAAAAMVFGHTLTAFSALGSSGAIGGGDVALASGAAGFLVIVLHMGFGLQLRRPKLKDRPKKRRLHVATAIVLSVAVIVHVVVLLRSA
jgi:hypothetical protein